MWYLSIIVVCMLLITIANSVLGGFGLGEGLLIVTLTTIEIILVDGLFAYIVRHLLPNKWFTKNVRMFKVAKGERKFYDKLKIKVWKDKVLELGFFAGFRKNKLYDGSNNEYVDRFIMENNYGIIVHVMCILAGFSYIWFVYPMNRTLWVGLPVAFVNFILNLLPIFVLRYNIPKLLVLYKRNLQNLKSIQSEILENAEGADINKINV